MDQVHEILQNVAEERIVREHIDVIKKPIPHPFWMLAFLISQAGFAFLAISLPNHDQTNRTISVISIALIAASSIWGLSKALRARDKMWREVIKREAPELYQKIQKTDA
jgi:hypothetical protein